jgi:hypothetical protein
MADRGNPDGLSPVGQLVDDPLIVEAQDKRVVAIEVKLKRTIKDDDTRNPHWLREQIGDELLDAIVISTA